MTGHSVRSRLTGKLIMVFMIALTMLLAACGGSPTQNPSGPKTTTLRVLSAPGQPNPDFFNPFYNTNQGGDFGAQGLLYEPLYFTNLYNGQQQAWLAQSVEHNADLTQWTFHLRQNLKWSDGQAITSDDVVYTFELMKQYPGLDQSGVWGILKDVKATDASTIVFTTTAPNSTGAFRIGNQVYIVPKHDWSGKIGSDPTKFTNDKNLVTSGPYKLTSFNQDLITYDINNNYWGTKPDVKKILVPSIKDNTTAITKMIQGELDWMGTGWSPDLDQQFTQKDPAHNKTWFPASNTVMLYLNLTKAPFNDLNVRKAISAAINRDNLPQGIAQYAKVANPTGVVIPNQNKWIKSDYQTAKFETADKVDGYMTAAGFTKTGGIWTKAGQKLSMKVDVVNGWSDWDQDVENIVSDLKKAGFDASVNSQSGYTPYYDALSNGKYDAAISWTNSGPDPYFTYEALLGSVHSAPAGKAVTGTNFMRWDATTSKGFSAQTDKLIADYEKASDEAGQMQAIQGIEDIMVSQVPCIPLTVNVFWGEYTTKNWTGFPSADNPYDSSAPYNSPDFVNVIFHLKAATS